MSIGIWELLLILVIVLLLFGGSRLRNLGTDVGTAIRGFRDAMQDGEKDAQNKGKDNNVTPAAPEKLEHTTSSSQVGAAPLVDATFKDSDKV